jgi:hypothetical protein
MSSLGNPEERMMVVRSLRLRPDQYRKHWTDHGISTRSGHIRAMLDLADKADENLSRYERPYVIAMLRTICDARGDNDWPDDLHISDIIEKHLLRYVNEEAEHGREYLGGRAS